MKTFHWIIDYCRYRPSYLPMRSVFYFYSSLTESAEWAAHKYDNSSPQVSANKDPVDTSLVFTFPLPGSGKCPNSSSHCNLYEGGGFVVAKLSLDYDRYQRPYLPSLSVPSPPLEPISRQLVLHPASCYRLQPQPGKCENVYWPRINVVLACFGFFA